jgi:hypothetical protein
MLCVYVVLLGVAAGAASGGNGVHLSLGAQSRAMAVSWSIPAQLDPAALTGQVLRFGPDASCSTRAPAACQILSNWATQPAGSSGAGTFRNVSVCRADATDLVPGQRYFYRVDNRTGADAPPPFAFTFRPSFGAPGPAAFAIFGDLGVKSQTGANDTLLRLASLHAAGAIDAVFQVGDFAYDMREVGGEVGEQFLQDLEPVISSVPYM